eukprot:COSAG04_NODE_3501_length_2767_cov_25.537683_1_plen_452_part_10
MPSSWRSRLRRVQAHLGLCAAAADKVELPPHLGGAAADPEGHPALGTLEGPSPALRCWTVAELLGEVAAALEAAPPAHFPDPLAADHPAVEQFRRWGYIAVTDAVAAAPLARNLAIFRSKQPLAREVWRVAREAESRSPRAADMQYFDLPREDMGTTPEAWNSGAWGGFLVAQQAADFDAYAEVLANPRVLPLLLALAGPALHLMEVGARTVPAPPREEALASGGYTDWCVHPALRSPASSRPAEGLAGGRHRDFGESRRLPIGAAGADYNRVKCFAMLTDTEPDGGCAPPPPPHTHTHATTTTTTTTTHTPVCSAPASLRLGQLKVCTNTCCGCAGPWVLSPAATSGRQPARPKSTGAARWVRSQGMSRSRSRRVAWPSSTCVRPSSPNTHEIILRLDHSPTPNQRLTLDESTGRQAVLRAQRCAFAGRDLAHGHAEHERFSPRELYIHLR